MQLILRSNFYVTPAISQKLADGVANELHPSLRLGGRLAYRHYLT